MPRVLNSNVRCYPSEFAGKGFVEITAVLVAGDADDYAVYVGQGTTEFIKGYGDKLSFVEAKKQFPFIEEHHYRL